MMNRQLLDHLKLRREIIVELRALESEKLHAAIGNGRLSPCVNLAILDLMKDQRELEGQLFEELQVNSNATIRGTS